MGWITNEDNIRVFRIKFRESRKLHKLDFPLKGDAKAYLKLKNDEIQVSKARIAAESQIDQNLDRLSQLVDQIVEESLICQGMVRRKGVFQLVSRLNNPLTNEEKANIRRVKFKAKPRSFAELKGRQSEIETSAASMATKESLRG